MLNVFLKLEIESRLHWCAQRTRVFPDSTCNWWHKCLGRELPHGRQSFCTDFIRVLVSASLGWSRSEPPELAGIKGEFSQSFGRLRNGYTPCVVSILGLWSVCCVQTTDSEL